jgi:hypothetical protein
MHQRYTFYPIFATQQESIGSTTECPFREFEITLHRTSKVSSGTYTVAYDSHVRFEFEKESNSAATDPARGDLCNMHLVTIAPKMILLFLTVRFTENILKI